LKGPREVPPFDWGGGGGGGRELRKKRRLRRTRAIGGKSGTEVHEVLGHGRHHTIGPLRTSRKQ